MKIYTTQSKNPYGYTTLYTNKRRPFVLQPICAVVRFRSDTELHLTSAIGFQLSK